MPLIARRHFAKKGTGKSSISHHPLPWLYLVGSHMPILWEVFALPPLYLPGECGEICEIFQWKGDLDSQFVLNDATKNGLSIPEILHLGEEIADVFIYSSRLCQLCCVDFGSAVKSASPITGPSSTPSTAARRPNFKDIATLAKLNLMMFRSPRQLTFLIQSAAGQVAGLFAKHSENDSQVDLAKWTDVDKALLSIYMGKIGFYLFCLASMYDLDVGFVVARKFLKNEEKYPVQLSRGSSAKYTAYSNSTAKSESFSVSTSPVMISLMFALGIVIGIRLSTIRLR